jgi:hypothetical protein
MTTDSATRTVQALLERAGPTYARRAGIRLADKPAPLYQLLVLATLLSKPIGASIAVEAARQLRAAGGTAPRGMLRLSWQDRVDALGRAHYRRYDESTSTRLAESADFVLNRYQGDLRRLAQSAGRDRGHAGALLEEAPGIGPTGAAIFLREAQHVWRWARPFADDRVVEGAKALRLPHSTPSLTRLAGSDDLSRLGAALVDASLDAELRNAVLDRAPAMT